MKCKCKKNVLLPKQLVCWECWGKLSLEEQRENIGKEESPVCKHGFQEGSAGSYCNCKRVKMMERNPRSKSANQADKRDTLQPFKKIDGKVTENKDFMEVYGTEQMKAYDPEKAKFYEKKGYAKTKRKEVEFK